MSDGKSTHTAADQQVEYRMIAGTDERYRVGDDGSVWSCVRMGARYGREPQAQPGTWRRLTPAPNTHGHLRVGIARERRATSHYVHILVLTAFVGPCPPGLEGCHEDGNPVNNVLTNLRWDTHRNNMQDAVTHGTSPRGTRNGRAKLNDERVRTIRAAYATGMYTYTSLAREQAVTYMTIKRVVTMEKWGHVR